MRQPSVAAYLAEVEALRERGIAVGVAPHSVRACPRDWLEELGRYARRERASCSTSMPTSSRARSRSASRSTACGRSSCSPPRAASARGRRSCTRRTRTAPSSTCSATAARAICACPTTEADLGDGFLPAVRVRHRGIPLCIGSDSNVRIDPFEELRELEGIARRQDGRRGVFSTEELWEIGGASGAPSLGLDAWADMEVDVEHPSLDGVADEHLRRRSSRAAPPTSSCRAGRDCRGASTSGARHVATSRPQDMPRERAGVA